MHHIIRALALCACVFSADVAPAAAGEPRLNAAFITGSSVYSTAQLTSVFAVDIGSAVSLSRLRELLKGSGIAIAPMVMSYQSS